MSLNVDMGLCHKPVMCSVRGDDIMPKPASWKACLDGPEPARLMTQEFLLKRGSSESHMVCGLKLEHAQDPVLPLCYTTSGSYISTTLLVCQGNFLTSQMRTTQHYRIKVINKYEALLISKGDISTNPSVQNSQGLLGLIMRNHMARSKHSQERKVAVVLDFARSLAANLPGRQLLLVELGLSRPREVAGPVLVSDPVADEVAVSGVDENGDLFQKRREGIDVGQDLIGLLREGSVDRS